MARRPSDPVGSSGAPVRLTLVISSLGSGGAERVMAIMANYWASHGRPVTLLTFMAPDEPSFFSVDGGVEIKQLDLIGPASNIVAGLKANLRRVREIRRAIRASKPDVVISFMDRTNVLTLVATVGLGVPIVVEEHNDPHEERLDARWTMLRRITYQWAARVVTLSEPALAYFSPSIRRRGLVIPNPVVPPAGARVPGTQGEVVAGPTILAVGRLVPQKGFDLLLEAFASLEPRRRGWTLQILGEGSARAELEATRERLGLSDVVDLPGVVTTPGAAMARATLFVLSSRYEGFPTVLGEAMAVGLPVVAFDCPSGPRQMIRAGVDGILVPRDDVAALAREIERVLCDDELRSRLAAQAPEVLERFGLTAIMERWQVLIDELLAPVARV
ncbi:MAG: glycosyltransferase family 4 protein [Chloroflexi bacterium]|nr:glycosyltransferase family 4 protein [Chloroflexota bacterium]